MALSKLFTRFKSIGPVIVIGASVLITIKLLTTQTPQKEEIIQVKAEEDIKKEEYEDKIEEPKQEPPAEEQKEKEPEKKVEEAGEETQEEAAPEEESADSEAPNTQEEQTSEQSQEQKPPENPKTALMFRSDSETANILKRLLMPSQKQ